MTKSIRSPGPFSVCPLRLCVSILLIQIRNTEAQGAQRQLHFEGAAFALSLRQIYQQILGFNLKRERGFFFDATWTKNPRWRFGLVWDSTFQIRALVRRVAYPGSFVGPIAGAPKGPFATAFSGDAFTGSSMLSRMMIFCQILRDRALVNVES